VQEAEGDRGESESTGVHYFTAAEGDPAIAEQTGGEEHRYQRLAAL